MTSNKPSPLISLVLPLQEEEAELELALEDGFQRLIAHGLVGPPIPKLCVICSGGRGPVVL